MCSYQATQETTGFMPSSFFESCVNQLSEIGISTLCLHFGGESLVHPEFKKFLMYAIQKRDEGGIGSVGWTENGMLFNEKIADLVVKLKLDFINFSIDGVGQVNDEIRLGSKYSVIEKNIKYLIEKRGDAKKPIVLLNMVDYGKTEQQKLDLLREWFDTVDGIDIIPSIRPDNSWENKKFVSQNIQTISPPSFCPFGFNTIIISWDGKVTGCCLDYVFRLDLGNAMQKPIRQIWEGSKFRAFRKAVVTSNYPVGSPCYKCEFWKINFKPKVEIILDGKAKIEYGYVFRKVRKCS